MSKFTNGRPPSTRSSSRVSSLAFARSSKVSMPFEWNALSRLGPTLSMRCKSRSPTLVKSIFSSLFRVFFCAFGTAGILSHSPLNAYSAAVRQYDGSKLVNRRPLSDRTASRTSSAAWLNVSKVLMPALLRAWSTVFPTVGMRCRSVGSTALRGRPPPLPLRLRVCAIKPRRGCTCLLARRCFGK